MKRKQKLITLAILVVSSARAEEWIVRDLHPDGAIRSRATAGDVYRQFGSVVLASGQEVAARWMDSTSTFQNLNPRNATSSAVIGGSGPRFAGYAMYGSSRDAGSWGTTLQSWMPVAISTDAILTSSSNGRHAGYELMNGSRAFFGDTPNGYRTLHRTGWEHSLAWDTDGTVTVGYAVYFFGTSRATLWWPSTDFRDLQPAGAYSSQALAVSGAQIGGSIRATVNDLTKAVMWAGSNYNVIVDMHPVDAEASFIRDMSTGIQVGSHRLDSRFRASLWRGSKNSHFDLHTLLPSDFESSYATFVVSDPYRTVVLGYGVTFAGQERALMWSTPVPEPGAIPFLATGFIYLLRSRRTKRA